MLILAAAGGVGHLAVQIAKARGAYVIGTARAAKHAFLAGLGADEAIDYTSEPVEDRVRDVDVVLDLVGDESSAGALETLRDGGIFISVPSGSGLDALREAAGDRVRVTGILVEPDRPGDGGDRGPRRGGRAPGPRRADVPARGGRQSARARRDGPHAGQARADALGGLSSRAMARFVLVHGAFGGAWSWEPIVEPLEALGHTVETFDLPGGGDDQTPVEEITLDGCADRVCSVLARRPEPAVLVGYSMGGVVVDAGGRELPGAGRVADLRRLVHALERPEPARPERASRRARAT